VLVLTQYNPRSLNDHIGTGRPWGFDRPRGLGIKILQPYISAENRGWYLGTADAVRYNLHEIDQSGADTVLILGGDHVYKMDYRPMIAAHHANGADVTIAVLPVPPDEATRMGICALDAAGRVVDWEEKPAEPKSDLASMGIYVFSRATLHAWLTPERSDFGHDVIPAMLAGGASVFGHRFEGYWRDVGTVEAYWKANLDLVGLVPPLDLFDRTWLIHTRSEERSPAKMGPDALARHSLVSHGCIVNGTVLNSVLVGTGDERAIPNADEPERLFTGITVVGERSRIPPGARIGRNCLVAPRTAEADFSAFPDLVVPSGASVGRRGAPTEPTSAAEA
jgi:glucose-1-phosphate adenylyltransferase